MDWARSIQNAIDYIENHISEEIDYSAVAREAACSSFYFQRIFTVLCGMTMGEYIRSRRLALAGVDLASTEIKVIDAALKYGYESPESFARAFAKFHGFTPSEARREGRRLKSFSRLTVQIILKGGTAMDYRIEEKGAMRLIEKSRVFSTTDGEQLREIPKFWSESRKNGSIQTLIDHSTGEEIVYGVCDDSGDPHTADYSIGFKCAADCVPPEGYRIREIPALTWAVFECHGPMPQAVQDAWKTICAEFFPSSGYAPSRELYIEVYPLTNYTVELWVPVKRK